PLSILKQAQAGTITPEAIEAVATVYPELFQQMRQRTIDYLGKHGNKTVPYQSQLGLTMLLGVNVSPTTSGPSLMLNQAVYARKKGGGGQAGSAMKPLNIGAGRAKALTLSTRTLTPLQASNARR